MRRILPRTKGLRHRSAQQIVSFDRAPVRTRTRIHYYSQPTRRVSAYSAIRPRPTAGRISAIVGASVAGAAVGAMMGSIANEAGLLNSMPAQNKVGISATGIVGVGLIVIGFFAKSEGMKLLFFALGGGLVIEEVTRQIDMRFYDFRVAFAGAPALDYSQGISGAQVQLSMMNAPAGTPGAPPALPNGSPAGFSPPPALDAAHTPATRTPTPGPLGLILLNVSQTDIPLVKAQMEKGVPFVKALNTAFDKRGSGIFLNPSGTALDVISLVDFAQISQLFAAGMPFPEAVNQRLTAKGFPRLTTSGQQHYDPSAVYRYAINTGGFGADPSAEFRYALRVA